MEREPKISLPEIILIGFFLLLLDGIDLIPFAGDFTDIFAAPLIFYYVTKQINGVAYGISLLLDLIPGIQAVPTRSLVWWGTVAFDRFAPKKLATATESVGELAEGNLGEGVGEEAIGAEAGAQSAATTATAQEAISAETASAEAAGAESTNAKPSEKSTERDRSRGNTFEDNTDFPDYSNSDEEDEQESKVIPIGAEISPEEEAGSEDFTLPEENLYDENDPRYKKAA